MRTDPAAWRPLPVFGPSEQLDFEAELGFVVGAHSHLGDPVPVERFAEHVFGACLVNDWSARDIQRWESVPLGPFLGKSFGTTISPWILPLAALENARVRPPSRDTRQACYLAETDRLGPRHRLRGPAQRAPGVPAAVRDHVLEPGPDAGAPDVERRARCGPATCTRRARSAARSRSARLAD